MASGTRCPRITGRPRGPRRTLLTASGVAVRHGSLAGSAVAVPVFVIDCVAHEGHGTSPRSIEVDGGRTRVTADVAPSTDGREFVELLADRYPSVDRRSQRHVQRDSHTRRELVASLLESLTARQLEGLRTAYFAGCFEWPRESTGEEVAELLEETQSTGNRHRRRL